MNIAERLLTVLWIGSLWTVGYIVAPTLFAMLDDRTLAGQVAGRLFSIEAYLGLLCGTVLLVGRLWRRGWRPDWRSGVLLVMLVLVAVGQFVVQPQMAALKLQGAAQAAAFGRLHGLSAILYLLVSLLGLVWVVGAGRACDGRSG